MRIQSVLQKNLHFSALNKSNNDDFNPISAIGEDANLTKATALAGVGVGLRALFFLWEEGFEFQNLFKIGKGFVDKNKKHVTGAKKDLLYLGAFGAVTAGFVSGVALLYTLYKTPENLYKGKVKAYTKGKDMDIYAKSNDLEKELYNQMLAKSKNATPEEKEKLKLQYLKLRAAKNQIPESVKSPSMNLTAKNS